MGYEFDLYEGLLDGYKMTLVFDGPFFCYSAYALSYLQIDGNVEQSRATGYKKTVIFTNVGGSDDLINYAYSGNVTLTVEPM